MSDVSAAFACQSSASAETTAPISGVSSHLDRADTKPPVEAKIVYGDLERSDVPDVSVHDEELCEPARSNPAGGLDDDLNEQSGRQ